MPHLARLAATAAVFLSFVASASAATTVNVVETGEGGGPMTLEIDKVEIHAGPTLFDVKNDAATEEHELILVRLNSADAQIPLDSKSQRIDEENLLSLGEVEDLKPGESGTLSADLVPGTYLLFCNIKGHYNSGMHARLNVVE
ncbi:MAG TPA: sulfocyanin-like copper-binding protein [Rhizobiaceae bacterium]